jgi:hypothetical protein
MVASFFKKLTLRTLKYRIFMGQSIQANYTALTFDTRDLHLTQFCLTISGFKLHGADPLAFAEIYRSNQPPFSHFSSSCPKRSAQELTTVITISFILALEWALYLKI